MKIEEAVRNRLLSQAAVVALVAEESIRPDALLQTDTPPGIYIEILKEEFDNDISGTTTLVGGQFLVSACSGSRSKMRAIVDAVAQNDTNPGTGLAGCTVITGDLPFQAMLTQTTFDKYRNPDGTNTWVHVGDSLYSFTCNQTV